LTALLALALAGALVACGSNQSPGVATLGRGTSAPSSGQDFDAAMVSYARCMRSHGSNVPDPIHRTGHAGLSIELPSGASDDPTFQSADAQCNHYLAGLIAMKRAHQAQIAASEMDKLVAYARCMRSHQIPMLDPGPLGELNLGNVPGITGSVGRYTPEFRAADHACRHLLPSDVRDDGSGP
jgi:hypothetical protein